MPEQKESLAIIEEMIASDNTFYVNTIIISETYHILTRMLGKEEAMQHKQSYPQNILHISPFLMK